MSSSGVPVGFESFKDNCKYNYKIKTKFNMYSIK